MKAIYKKGDRVVIPDIPEKSSGDPDDMGFWGRHTKHPVGAVAILYSTTDYRIKTISRKKERMYSLKFADRRHWYRESVLLKFKGIQMTFTFYEEEA